MKLKQDISIFFFVTKAFSLHQTLETTSSPRVVEFGEDIIFSESIVLVNNLNTPLLDDAIISGPFPKMKSEYRWYQAHMNGIKPQLFYYY